MNTFVSLLRGINVSGQKRVLMPELKSMYETLGFTRVTTYVQSGNVVFESDRLEETQIAPTIEAEIARIFGFPVSVIVRGRDDLRRILAANPFIERKNIDTKRLYVTFLRDLPSLELSSNLITPPESDDEFLEIGKEIFLYCPGGYGRTKLSNNYFEKKLWVIATTRNWNTVKALSEMADRRIADSHTSGYNHADN
jgi:uncharacterized protein (DUF1697 family)